MSERLRRKILNSWFYPVTRSKKPGIPLVAPPRAVQKRNELRKNWLIEHPKTPNESPIVSVDPGEKDGQEGFFVITEIKYKP
jgi:hypothetical protein